MVVLVKLYFKEWQHTDSTMIILPPRPKLAGWNARRGDQGRELNGIEGRILGEQQIASLLVSKLSY